ncbi:hypothetical protein [Streptomyces sp. BPTC-684]|uniref:hypothetical protein n=1 Tax=Streptomyces sp. BPTC-684 TaxID=3043734 RepID=UPI0024B07830|nr:hypothetical protein [Streptomyces sp. BPTC-684]WHM37990.1 hypothetical protein QIY60_14435 [Streptomyces sp. BPTC-684]
MAEKAKFSVSLDAELGEALRRYAEAEDEQISAVVSRALEDFLGHRRLLRDGRDAMEGYQAEQGRFTEEERAEADAWLDGILGSGEKGSRSA